MSVEPSVTNAALAFSAIALIGFWREMNALKKHMISWTARIDTTLFGASGNNGLNGITKDHEERLRYLERARIQTE